MAGAQQTARDQVRSAIKERKLCRVAPILEVTDTSRNAFYGAIKRGEIEAIYVGKNCIRIPPHEAARLTGEPEPQDEAA